eukprot:363309-Chlamydomonas_euryale.AAC.29
MAGGLSTQQFDGVNGRGRPARIQQRLAVWHICQHACVRECKQACGQHACMCEYQVGWEASELAWGPCEIARMSSRGLV